MDVIHDFLADRTVQYFPQMLVIMEEVDRAHLDALHPGPFVAELAGGIHVHDDLSALDSLTPEERALIWTVSLEDSIGKEALARRLDWGNSKLNACLASVKRKNAISVSTLPKDGSGRKPLAFSVSPDIGCFIGINCSIEADYFVLLDASGRTIAEKSFPALSSEEDAVEEFAKNWMDSWPIRPLIGKRYYRSD